MTARRLVSLCAAAVLAALVCACPAGAAPLRFGPPAFVDQALAGGEPLVFADKVHHTLVYTSHEGTTHLYRPGLVSGATAAFGVNYRNQVNLWTSADNGLTWKRVNFAAGFVSPPVANTGFSDPDLTQDAGGRIYDTGIDLVNDALFSSADGGRSWNQGTVNCSEGDRPWLAGARRDEVFLATNTTRAGHQVFRSIDGGRSCPVNGIPDSGDLAGHHYDGNGKLLYDPIGDRLAEPITLDDGLGVSTWSRRDAAFTPHRVYTGTTYAHWPMLVEDRAGTLYLVWDTDPRVAGTTGGCDGAPTPAPNRVQMAFSKDFGRTWSAPRTIAAPPSARAFWPWAVAGDAGKLSIVWYQTDKVADLECQPAALRVMEATLTGASSAAPQTQTADVVGRPIANNNICQNGTTCVATGEDRRLGDFFTNAIDERGCVLVATGDTTQKDPLTGAERPTSLPLFVRQTSGPRLIGRGDCSQP
ncbi:MAG: hypothetical protein QOH72_3882 [Solirubrobacteraceae bacterium]|jgi:hypothetical protein|nr:hypothetical protein [Solirubrobacteraceae bacterium]